MYVIVRFFRDGPSQVIKSGLTLEEAREHCNDPSTEGDGWFAFSALMCNGISGKTKEDLVVTELVRSGCNMRTINEAKRRLEAGEEPVIVLQELLSQADNIYTRH
jgi:hypothetical protein